MKYFTYLWKNETWEKKAALSKSSYPELDYAASDKFLSSGVSENSTIFIVTVKNGELFLGGTITVADIVGKNEAAKHLGRDERDLWDASDYIIAKSENITYFVDDLKVDDAIVRSLEFAKKGGGFKNLKIDSDGKINGQTLRNVRELYNGEHAKLLALL